MTTAGIKPGLRIRKSTVGGLKRVVRIRKKTASGLQQVFSDVPTLAASASDASFFSSGNATVEGAVSISATGGMMPYSYATTVLSSTNSTAVINSNTANPTLRQTGVATDATGTASMRTVVTDNSGQSVQVNYTAEFTNVGIS